MKPKEIRENVGKTVFYGWRGKVYKCTFREAIFGKDKNGNFYYRARLENKDEKFTTTAELKDVVLPKK